MPASILDQPLVSVLINNYNYAKFVSKAIDSALNQTYGNIEVIVVDDGSKDNSIEVLKGYEDTVEVVYKENGGQGSAMNRGFEKSRGQLITLLDADDYLFPDAIERIVETWVTQSQQSDISQVQCSLELVDADGKHIDVYPRTETPFDSGNVLPLLLKKGRYRTTVTSGLSYSRSALEKMMPIPEADFRISADGYLVATAPFYGNIASIDTPVAARVYHDSNLWSSSGASDAGKKFRDSIEHDFSRYKYIKATAAKLELEVAEEPGLKDIDHLTNRIASLCINQETHPISPDSRLAIGLLGSKAALSYAKLKLSRRFLLGVWFLWAGIMPLPLAKPFVLWLCSPKSRPEAITKLAKKVRSATR